jgi:hypothetical protein
MGGNLDPRENGINIVDSNRVRFGAWRRALFEDIRDQPGRDTV